MAESVRADVWTWAVRVYKSRSMASSACKAGHVSVNGHKVKASHAIKIGDTVESLTPGGTKKYVVTRVITKRVGAAVAAGCYEDHSPPPLPKAERPAVVAQRDPGAGRPTKRDRRRLDALRARSEGRQPGHGR
ncbi:RNA-binding S4 domain-containing protein [Aeromicrobium sp. CF3.5]|uniref:RNA-binding S4 domain-containing protein n=1 Tax=Aeromicrobium sp. CF3.5 TaxID=3373078 RepID=UPI003EE5A137